MLLRIELIVGYLLQGKFAQRPDMKKVQYVNSPEEYFKLLTATSITVKQVYPISEELVRVDYLPREYFVDTLENTNVCIAVLTTSHARLCLYSYLEMLQERVLYFDTDSIIFKSPRNIADEVIPTGSALGDLTDELGGPEKFITSFVSGGPKNYSFKVSDGSVKMTVKGITLNKRNASVVTFDLLKELVLKEGREKVQVVDPRHFYRDPFKGEISTKPHAKTYQMVYTKRRILPDGVNTVPFGTRD